MLKFTMRVLMCLWAHLRAFTPSRSVCADSIHTFSVFLWGVDQTCLDSNAHSGVVFQTWKCLSLLSQPLICCLLGCTLPLGTHASSRLGPRPRCTLWHDCRPEHITLRKTNTEPLNAGVIFSNFHCVRLNLWKTFTSIFSVYFVCLIA